MTHRGLASEAYLHRHAGNTLPRPELVSRYFYPWTVVGWLRLAEEDKRAEPRAGGS